MCGAEIAPGTFMVSLEVMRPGRQPLYLDFDKPACVRQKLTDAVAS
jgi:hypothetical protein